ncbi:MAG: DUF6662 family protein, partial [Verrucomicrobiota bacterium]
YELKLGGIARLGKDSGHYRFYDIRPELEYGVTDRLTLGGELILFHHDYSVNDPLLQPLFDTQGGEGGDFKSSQIGGFEISTKYNVLSPYKDPLGLTLGFSYERRERYRLDGAEIDQNSYVPTLYLQKNFLDDTLIFAFKGKMELELRKSPGVREEEIAFDLALGTAYRFKPKWYIGFEVRWQSDFLEPEEEGEPEPENPSEFTSLGNFRLGTQFQHGTYIGPSIHYAEQRWYITAGILWQVYGGGDETNDSVDGNRVWDEHEKVHIGLTYAYNF